MNADENIAYKFFEYQAFENIEFEPQGNRSPDFVINKKIGVEVRRLNQHIKRGNSIKPLEELDYKLIPRLRSLFKTYNKDDYTSSAFIGISYNRPLKIDKQLLDSIKLVINQHSLNMNSTEKYFINNSLSLEIMPSQVLLEDKFTIGFVSDRDSGGFVLHNILESLEIIIKEKEPKIIPYLNEYEEWWLTLIDHIGYSLSKNELSEVKMHLPKNLFKRIYFISPINHEIGDYI
jgi:hypothetical protein